MTKPRDFYDSEYHFAEDAERPDEKRIWRSMRHLAPLDGATFLDLGCGAGWATRMARARGAKNLVGLDFSRTALDLDRRRRGFTPWPGLWTRASGAVLKIHDSEPLPSGGRAPGEIVGASAAGIDVSCAGGTVLRLREVQPEGRKRMPASAYLAGHPLRPSDRLGS